MVLITGFQKEESMKKYGAESKRVLKRQKKKKCVWGKIPVQFCVTWALIWTVIKILKEDEEDNKEMTSSLSEYKLGDQILKSIEEAIEEWSLCRQNQI